MKKNAGVTLIELIVVIAILAILAGIAIPVYSGYIEKAKEAADYQVLDAVKTATIFAAVDVDKEHDANVTAIVVNGDGSVKSYKDGSTEITVEKDSDVEKEIKSLLGDKYTALTSNSFKDGGAKWESTGDNANKWVKP